MIDVGLRTRWERFRGWVRRRVNLRRDYDTLSREFSDVCSRCVKAEEAAELERKINIGLHRRARDMELRQEQERAAIRSEVPGLTPGEIERLAILGEECGEVVRAVGKILRFGWESQSPYGGRMNREALEREIGSVRAIVNLMLDADDVGLQQLQAWQRSKRLALMKWTLYQDCSMPREEQLAMMRAIVEQVR